MTARAATVDDTSEVVRLAAVLFASMGADVSDPAWLAAAREQFARRLGQDVMAFVVDHPERTGLAASAAGSINTRLPTPFNHSARVGYVQWVATDDDARRRGYAREVMDALLHWYRQQDVAIVELHSTPVAEPLYRDLGFSDEGPIALRRR